ncbi:Cell division protein FtsL [Desulfarculales bacterium]
MNVSIRLPNRRLPDEESAQRLSLLWVLLLLVMATAVALVYAYTAIRAQNLSYELSRGLEAQRELLETGRRLRVELNNLRSPGRLELEAQRRGLLPPKPEQLRGRN